MLEEEDGGLWTLVRSHRASKVVSVPLATADISSWGNAGCARRARSRTRTMSAIQMPGAEAISWVVRSSGQVSTQCGDVCKVHASVVSFATVAVLRQGCPLLCGATTGVMVQTAQTPWSFCWCCSWTRLRRARRGSTTGVWPRQCRQPSSFLWCGFWTRLWVLPVLVQDRGHGPDSAAVEIPQVQSLDKVDMPGVVQRHVRGRVSAENCGVSAVAVHRRGVSCSWTRLLTCPFLCTSYLGVETVLETEEVSKLQLFNVVVVQFLDKVIDVPVAVHVWMLTCSLQLHVFDAGVVHFLDKVVDMPDGVQRQASWSRQCRLLFGGGVVDDGRGWR